MESDGLLRPTRLGPLEGGERLGPATVLDFWRWALGDLRMNNTRGHLVEFLVARALGDTSRCRVEWDSYDVEAADGTRVEVKTTGRLQSWTTRGPSRPSWSFGSVRAERRWCDASCSWVAVDAAERVHVWVFALHTVVEPAAYDPLDIAQWEFRVVAHRDLLASGQTSASPSFFDRLGAAPVSYPQLPDAVAAARRRNDRLALEA